MINSPFLKGYGSSSEIGPVSAGRCQASHQQCHAYFVFDIVEERVLPNWYPVLFDDGCSWPPSSLVLNPCNYFVWECLKCKVFQRNQHTVQGLKTVIWTDSETISTKNFNQGFEQVCFSFTCISGILGRSWGMF